jgi:hypothetical protein
MPDEGSSNEFVNSCMCLLVGAGPWLVLSMSAHPEDRNTLMVDGVLLFVVIICAFIFLRFRHTPRHLVFLFILACTSTALGLFATFYYALSLRSPNSFSSPLTRIDAVYFTMSTATTTGMGDIHPVSGTARLLVTGQMVLSLFLVAAALGIAFQRLFGEREQ